jgi:uncharacterized protein YjiS (DUF1127 family)
MTFAPSGPPHTPLVLGSLTGDTLEDLADYAADNANAIAAAADAFVGALVADSAIDFDVGDLDSLNYLQWDYDAELAALQRVIPGYLTFDTATVDLDIDKIAAIAVPDAPTLSLPTAAIPTLDAERPVISMPALPGTDVGDAPGDAPSVTEYAVPDAPTYVLPTVPTFEELQIPVSPSFSLPSFASEMPQNQLVAPTDQFGYVDAGYTSVLRDPLVAKLLYDLENGGYGIDSADELALWGRARDRAEAAGRQAVEEALKRAAATSFPMPTGALYADMQRARAELAKALSEANRDIALKRADLYVENRKFTIQEVRQLEAVSIALYNAIQERALNAAKSVVELGIAAFEATVRNYSAQLDAHKTEAAVFETRIRAELAKAELYRTQVAAEQLRGEFNKTRAELYQAQLNGIQTTVNLYKTRVEAVSTLSEIQAQKVEIFKSRIQAYSERVRAKASEYDMYKAAVSGEIAKLDIYKTDIGAFETRVRAEESRTRVLLQGNEALLQRFKAQVDQYNAQLTGASKKVDARIERDRTYVAAQAVNASVYRALTDAVNEGIRTKVAAQKMNNDWNIATLNSRVEGTRFRLEELKATIANRVDIEKFGAKFYGDALTATLASLAGLSVKSA